MVDYFLLIQLNIFTSSQKLSKILITMYNYYRHQSRLISL